MFPSKRSAWSVVALLWPVAVLNYLDRQMLATMGLSIKLDIVELQSSERFGELMGAFLWVYALVSPCCGWVADRVNRKWLIVASLAIWSAVTLLMGQAHDFSTLLWLRRSMGLSEAFYIPAALSLVADFHRGGTRALAVGIHMSGIYMGQALGGIGGWIAQSISWRAAFTGCGWVGVTYGLVLALFLPGGQEAARHTAGAEDSPAPGQTLAWWRGFFIVVLCFALPSLPGWAVKNWLPTLLQDRFHLDQMSSGLWATTTNAGAGFLGVLLGGRVADAFFVRHVRARTWVSTCGLCLTAVAICGIGLMPTFWSAIFCTMLYGLGFGIYDANNIPILCQTVAPRFRATGIGLMNLCGIAAGALVTPQLGRLKDQGTPLAVGFAYCALPALAAAVLMFLLRPRERDHGADPEKSPV